jgi:hypothetical protein
LAVRSCGARNQSRIAAWPFVRLQRLHIARTHTRLAPHVHNIRSRLVLAAAARYIAPCPTPIRLTPALSEDLAAAIAFALRFATHATLGLVRIEFRDQGRRPGAPHCSRHAQIVVNSSMRADRSIQRVTSRARTAKARIAPATATRRAGHHRRWYSARPRR